jgi:hypothetical protein
MAKFYSKKPSGGTVLPNSESLKRYPNPYSPVNDTVETPMSHIDKQISNDISKINSNKKPRKA